MVEFINYYFEKIIINGVVVTECIVFTVKISDLFSSLLTIFQRSFIISVDIY